MLKEVPLAEIFKFKPLFIHSAKELKSDITADEAVMNLHRGCSNGYMKSFTDDIENPSHVLIVSHFPGVVHSGFVAVITTIYSLPQKRHQKYTDAMLKTAEDYARSLKCRAILGSAWKFRGTRGIDSIWLSQGYEIQETTYVKFLQ